MIQLSVNPSGGLALFTPTSIGSAQDLADLITKVNYSTIVYRGNHRSEENFETSSIIGLDFDTGTPTLEQAKLLFAPYRHVIATTRNHRKVKDGKAAVDRFRVLLFLSRPVSTVGEYRTTWLALNRQFSGLDPQTKDAARLWFKSEDIVSVSNEGLMVEPSTVAPVEEEPEELLRLTEKSDQKGKLTTRTCRLLAEGAKTGSRNQSYFKAAKDFQEQGYDYDEALERLLAAPREGDFPDEEIETSARSAYRKEPKYAPRLNPNEETLKQVNENPYVIDMATNEGFLFLKNKGRTKAISEDSLRRLLGKEGFDAYKVTNYINCSFEYRPFDLQPLLQDELGFNVYNTYEPPQWQRDLFYFGKPLPAAPSAAPKIYQEFLQHLFNGDASSIEYVYDWLANGMRERNRTMLVLISEEGSGKGTFSLIMRALFGAANHTGTRDEILKGRFNAALANKRIVVINEVEITSNSEHNKLKELVDEHITIERKGVDEEFRENYANICIVSNHLNAVKPSPSDRRLSVVQTTDVKLKDTPLIKRLGELLDEGELTAFALYLNSRPIKHDMLTPFRSARYDDVKEASLSEWEYYLVFEWTAKNKGKFRTIRDIQEDLRLSGDLRSVPGRVKIQSLVKKYPQCFEFKKRNGIQGVEVLAAPADVIELRPAPLPMPKGI